MKVVLQNGRMVGAVLIGDTDLEVGTAMYNLYEVLSLVLHELVVYYVPMPNWCCRRRLRT